MPKGFYQFAVASATNQNWRSLLDSAGRITATLPPWLLIMPLSLSHRSALASAAVSAIFFSLPVQAQIVPDGTLGTQAIGACGGTGGACGIINGTTRGSNLFHSFQQFSLPNGDAANFITNATIQNVIVRVTGVGQPFISNINGAIATSNPANFFLLNPNGIIFGSGAALDIRGSFLATTADRMRFQDGVEFRTTDPAPLLTINVPIGLGFTGVPKPIQMRSSFLSPNVGDDFRDFVLVGGNISLDDTEVTTPGRRVELAAIGAPGTVGLAVSGNSLRLSLSDNLSRADYPC